MDSSQFDHIERRLPVPPSPLRALPLEFGYVLKATEVLLGSVSSEHQTMAGPAAGGEGRPALQFSESVYAVRVRLAHVQLRGTPRGW